MRPTLTSSSRTHCTISSTDQKCERTLQLMYRNWLCLCKFNTEHFEFLHCYGFVSYLLGTNLYKSVNVNLKAFLYTVKLTFEEGWGPADAPDDGWFGNESLMLILWKWHLYKNLKNTISCIEDSLNVPIINLHVLIWTYNAIAVKRKIVGGQNNKSSRPKARRKKPLVWVFQEESGNRKFWNQGPHGLQNRTTLGYSKVL